MAKTASKLAPVSKAVWVHANPPPPPPRNFLKSGPLRVHFQHSGAKTRVFELNTDILNSMTFFIQRQHMDNFYFYLFLLPLLL